MKITGTYPLLVLCWMVWGCKNDLPAPASGPYPLEVPEGFPLPFIPDDNALTYERIAFGKKLFYDPILSLDSSRSCASCHLPALAFSDSVAFSLGIENRVGTRNSPTLANVAYQKALLREGGIPTLEMQVLVPIQEHNEFDFNILVVAERMLADPEYVEISMATYDRAPDPYVITRAIAAFERTMISGESPFDLFYFQGKNNALSASQKRGWDLFRSDRLNCSKCHEGFLFTSQGFANNGLYEDYPDPGRFRLTCEEGDRAVFKIPTLRNIALTSPYMHDGSLSDLQSVLAHYESGGHPHVNKSDLVKSFSLTEQERADLLGFLQSLTDENFIQNPDFQQ